MACAVNEVRTNAKAALTSLFAANSITYSVAHVVDEQHAVDLAGDKQGRMPKLAGIVAARTPKKVLQMAGIEDCYTCSRGSTKTLGNFVKATFYALAVSD